MHPTWKLYPTWHTNKKRLDNLCLVIQSCVATSYPHRGKPPTTIGAKKLNFCVRHGNRCILLAFATVLFWAFTLKTKHNPSRKKPSSLLRFGQVLDWLVLVRSILHRTSTPSLSTSSSLRCLTAYAKEISSWGGLRT